MPLILSCRWCYHVINVITFVLAQSDNIKRLLLYHPIILNPKPKISVCEKFYFSSICTLMLHPMQLLLLLLLIVFHRNNYVDHHGKFYSRLALVQSGVSNSGPFEGQILKREKPSVWDPCYEHWQPTFRCKNIQINE